MQMNSIDRKAKKYQPFDSLKGFKENLYKVENEKLKISMPLLSEDEIERINLNIISAYANLEDISIDFYKDGYIYQYKGRIKKIDIIKRCLIFVDKVSISLENIVSVLKE